MNYRKTILFVDGYNVINAWSDLNTVLEEDLEGARDKLNDFMFEYAAFYDEEVYVVYDAYMQSGKMVKVEERNHVHIVYTKENQTADAFIEKKVSEFSSDVRIMIKVVTSDWVQQRQILGSGGIRLTPWELKSKCDRIKRKIERKYNKVESTAVGHQSFKNLDNLLKEHKK